MMGVYGIIGAAAIGAGSLVGSFVYGRHVEAQHQELAGIKEVARVFKERVDQALTIADKFAVIAADLAKNQAATQAAARSRRAAAEKVINENPLSSACVVRPELVRLRCDAIASLYRAAGKPMPGGCAVAAAAAGAIADDNAR